eukprot:gene8673-biopygen19660
MRMWNVQECCGTFHRQSWLHRSARSGLPQQVLAYLAAQAACAEGFGAQQIGSALYGLKEQARSPGRCGQSAGIPAKRTPLHSCRRCYRYSVTTTPLHTVAHRCAPLRTVAATLTVPSTVARR